MKLSNRIAFGALVAAAVGVMAAAPASAQQIAPKDYYGAVGVSITGSPNTIGVAGRVGANLVDAWGVEGDVMIGLTEEDYGFNNAWKTDWTAGVFGTYTYPLNEQFSVYGRVGLAGVSYSWSSGAFGADGSSFGVGVGIGADYNLSGVGKLRADYTSYAGQGVLTGAYVFGF